MPNLFLSRRAFLGAATCMIAVSAVPALAAKINLSNGIAIKGYDPVAYFSSQSAQLGDASITASFDGATYQFVSATNRDAFVANPAKYVPQYGGFCAYAASKGSLAPVDPEAFSVVDDKLYLNFSKTVRTVWSEDIPGNIKKADANWPALSAQ